jgi:hypothetical protein
VLVAAVLEADCARGGHVVLEADILCDKEDDTFTWL